MFAGNGFARPGSEQLQSETIELSRARLVAKFYPNDSL